MPDPYKDFWRQARFAKHACRGKSKPTHMILEGKIKDVSLSTKVLLSEQRQFSDLYFIQSLKISTN